MQGLGFRIEGYMGIYIYVYIYICIYTYYLFSTYIYIHIYRYISRGLYGGYIWFRVVMENRMEKEMADDMETGFMYRFQIYSSVRSFPATRLVK